MKKNFLKVAISLGFLAILIAPFVAGANNNEKIAICHFTGSETNPYVVITVSVNALDAHLSHGDLMADPEGGCSNPYPD